MSRASVIASTSVPSSDASEASGDLGSVGSDPASDNLSPSSSLSKEAIEVAKGGARCAIAAR